MRSEHYFILMRYIGTSSEVVLNAVYFIMLTELDRNKWNGPKFGATFYTNNFSKAIEIVKLVLRNSICMTQFSLIFVAFEQRAMKALIILLLLLS